MARLWLLTQQSQLALLTKRLLLPKMLNHLAKGNVFEKKPRRYEIVFINKEDGTSFYVRFFNTETTAKIYFKSPIKSVWKEVTRTVMM
jgi:hypothetical protein